MDLHDGEIFNRQNISSARCCEIFTHLQIVLGIVLRVYQPFRTTCITDILWLFKFGLVKHEMTNVKASARYVYTRLKTWLVSWCKTTRIIILCTEK